MCASQRSEINWIRHEVWAFAEALIRSCCHIPDLAGLFAYNTIGFIFIVHRVFLLRCEKIHWFILCRSVMVSLIIFMLLYHVWLTCRSHSNSKHKSGRPMPFALHTSICCHTRPINTVIIDMIGGQGSQWSSYAIYNFFTPVPMCREEEETAKNFLCESLVH